MIRCRKVRSGKGRSFHLSRPFRLTSFTESCPDVRDVTYKIVTQTVNRGIRIRVGVGCQDVRQGSPNTVFRPIQNVPYINVMGWYYNPTSSDITSIRHQIVTTVVNRGVSVRFGGSCQNTRQVSPNTTQGALYINVIGWYNNPTSPDITSLRYRIVTPIVNRGASVKVRSWLSGHPTGKSEQNLSLKPGSTTFKLWTFNCGPAS
jgi:hypothetical protein